MNRTATRRRPSSDHGVPARRTLVVRWKSWAGGGLERSTRLSSHRSRHDSLDSDFTREIEVDGDGLVVAYSGLFTRLA